MSGDGQGGEHQPRTARATNKGKSLAAAVTRATRGFSAAPSGSGEGEGEVVWGGGGGG